MLLRLINKRFEHYSGVTLRMTYPLRNTHQKRPQITEKCQTPKCERSTTSIQTQNWGLGKIFVKQRLPGN